MIIFLIILLIILIVNILYINNNFIIEKWYGNYNPLILHVTPKKNIYIKKPKIIKKKKFNNNNCKYAGDILKNTKCSGCYTKNYVIKNIKKNINFKIYFDNHKFSKEFTNKFKKFTKINRYLYNIIKDIPNTSYYIVDCLSNLGENTLYMAFLLKKKKNIKIISIEPSIAKINYQINLVKQNNLSNIIFNSDILGKNKLLALIQDNYYITTWKIKQNNSNISNCKFCSNFEKKKCNIKDYQWKSTKSISCLLRFKKIYLFLLKISDNNHYSILEYGLSKIKNIQIIIIEYLDKKKSIKVRKLLKNYFSLVIIDNFDIFTLLKL